MTRFLFLDGHFLPEDQAKIAFNDRGFLFGEGIFTTIRVHNGRCELLNSHLQRLKEHAHFLNFDLPSISYDWIEKLIHLNPIEAKIGRLKIIVTVKEENGKRLSNHLLIYLDSYEKDNKIYRLCNYPAPVERPLSSIKSLSYGDSLFICNFALSKGFDDAITKNSESFLLETSCANLFWTQGECLMVPDFSLPYLKGIFLKGILSHLSCPIQYVKETQIPKDASVYICNSLKHVRPVISIENQIYPRDDRWEKILDDAIHQMV